MNKIRHQQVADFIEAQLSCWQLAKQNYDALMRVKRREVKIGDFSVGIQWNPGRIISTGANISRQDIEKRPCFLCRTNRPEEQHIFPILPGWEMLVNPYPILPVHLTIVATEHKPQGKVPEDIVKIAEMLPGMVIFFNGAKAGASAPDHLHLQAVLKEELPLLRLVEKEHPENEPGLRSSESYQTKLPYLIFSGVVSPDNNGLRTLLAGLNLGGLDKDGKLTSPDLVNTFFWVSESGLLRFIVIPRKAHRPECYYLQGEKNRMVSPGCIDMAGLLIVPRENDYQQLTKEEIEKIYREVGI
ncbi:MAG: DUF4922 domain-containing protein [Bacteroides sp.]|nr:DUF4922 domain-containing protein [Bacteroides sp.]